LISHRTWRNSTYQTTTLIAVALLLLIMFVSAAYLLLLPTPDPLAEQKQVLADLQANLDSWNNRRPRSYRYVVDRTCFCTREALEPYIASEQRGYKTAAFRTPVTSETGEVLTVPPSPMWIDDVFALIEQSALDGDVVLVQYDPAYGFPKFVDVKRKPADASIRYDLRDFEVLEYW
jgi:hypothetical protein